MPKDDIQATPEQVEAIADWILEKGVRSWLKEFPDTTQADLFMGMHNAHRIVVESIARQLKLLEGVQPSKVARMADMTWRKTMREFARNEDAALLKSRASNAPTSV